MMKSSEREERVRGVAYSVESHFKRLILDPCGCFNIGVVTDVLSSVAALSQSVDDCTDTVQIVGTTQAPNQIDIPLGTVCVECVVNGEVVSDPTTTFLIGNSPITSLDGGVLVVDDTSMTFQASPALTLRCVSGSGAVRQASVYLDVYLPPIITGATTVNEGGRLFLTCDSTNSNREPLSQWFDKDGQMVSSSGVLNIPNIMRSQAGSYTCRTSPPNLDNSTSTTVTVVVQSLPQSVDDCTATVQIVQIVGTTQAPNQIDIPLGTVCVQCVVNGEIDTATTTTFLIGNSSIQEVVDNGVLVIDDTNMTFQASPALTLRCVSGSGAVRQASVYLDVYLPPIITGATTVNEGGRLFLTCDSTNSNREPLSQWFDKNGQMVSSSGVLNIPNIMRSQAGSYTCQTSPPNLDNSTSTTVTVGVQCLFTALSQSVDDCIATVQIVGTAQAPNQIDIPLGTVCVECVVNGEVVSDPTTTFLIGNSPITSLDGGVLVVDDTSMTFQASPALTLQCVSGSGAVRQASVYLDVYLPPIITGATTVNEGGVLLLTCDSANSNREPPSQWFDKDGQMVSSSGVLNIPNIMRSQAGNYTCQTSPPNLDNSTSTIVTVVVQYLPTASTTSTSTDTRATGVAVVISTIVSVLVSLPVGVAIGSFLFAIRRGGERGERKKKKKEEFGGAIYEEPVHSVKTAIPLSENQAYGQVSSQR
ncbi:Hemicentin-2 [Geodia barretti]|uniref:Hemicentin-2 n=1 Tax=Geodia barretti TaxID=519541 RepID=A0AA35T6A4_GEOBA|nr:Hemicentin-2 [Geodia barretti]